MHPKISWVLLSHVDVDYQKFFFPLLPLSLQRKYLGKLSVAQIFIFHLNNVECFWHIHKITLKDTFTERLVRKQLVAVRRNEKYAKYLLIFNIFFRKYHLSTLTNFFHPRDFFFFLFFHYHLLENFSQSHSDKVRLE